MGKSDSDNFMRLLAIIGGILAVIVAIICFMGFTNIINIAKGLVWILIGIVILMSCFKPNNQTLHSKVAQRAIVRSFWG